MSRRRARPGPKRLDYARLQERVVELHESVKTRQALEVHRKILRDDNPHALGLFGRIASRFHAYPMAIKLLERSIECGARDANDYNDLGLACLNAGRLDHARRCFDEAARRDPDDYRPPVNVAVVLQEQGQLDAALSQLERALHAHPEEVAVALRLAELHLRRGEPRDALVLLAELRSRKLHPTWPLALEAVACSEIGDEAAFQELMRYADFVRAIEAVLPDGFPDLATFNMRLRKHIVRHRTLVPDPEGFSTRNGQHTLGNLMRDRDPVLEALEVAIHRAVEHYVGTLPPPDGHPFLDRGDKFRIETWAVVLGQQGYHEAHVHRDGWLSGVYYVDVGDVVRDDDPGCEGWLELGRGPDALHRLGSSSWTERIRPRDGCFALFPSYCWHRTLPFAAAGSRVAVAFDFIPRR